MYLLVLKQLIIMLIIAVISFFVTKLFKFGEREQQCISKLLIYVINPCLILGKFDIDYDPKMLKAFFCVLIISVAVYAVMIGVSRVARVFHAPQPRMDPIDLNGSVFTNCGFVGIPLIEGVLGGTGVFLLLGYITVFNIVLWTYGYSVMTGKISLKKMITNPNVLCVIVGIILFCLPVRLPELVSRPLAYIGASNTACAMALLGMLFANFKKTSQENYTVRTIRFCIWRLVIIPAFVLAVLFAVMKFMPGIIDKDLLFSICIVVFIAALCPVAMNVSGMAVLFDKDESYGALICLVTSILCVGTMPLSVLLAERLLLL
ncbi:MAG: AEC family transporter [Treponema sp.]|nr:AEC family transporter [Treponema sp.]